MIPWLLTHWRMEPFWLPLRILGVAVLVLALAVLISAFARFVTEGFGTPAPVAPPDRLVVGGLYRLVRNPMYLAVLSLIPGADAPLRTVDPAALRRDREPGVSP
ncbi:phospholipid methyltransferase [Lentzea atacamensis]|uniref:Phospholipid methyltransferase n=1 Tax=Lentzea atacamensis TaxID=531938 RepID=A0ABX9EBB7_9PSEU|nr:methyltransferase [Lentzea atacamensis]RAS67188.1 phospholipid methyltransferase [Lentzea atacamensis]